MTPIDYIQYNAQVKYIFFINSEIRLDHVMN